MLKTIFTKKTLIQNIKKCYSSNSLSVTDILKKCKIGDKVNVKGWIKSLRNQKENIFMDLADGSTDKKLQIIVSKTVNIENLTTGSSVNAFGTLKSTPKGDVELSAENVEIYGKCIVTDGYPFAPRKQYSQEYIRQHLHFRPRTNKFSALLRVRHAATLAIHNYFHEKGYFNVNTSILTSNDCEGAGEVFKVLPDSPSIIKSMTKPGVKEDEAYFNTKTFLTVSGQLQLEAAVHGLSKVYTFGPTFRAENSRSRLHLSEFYMLEAELAFLEKIEELTNIVEDLIKSLTKDLVEKNSNDIHQCAEGDTNFTWLDKKFPIFTYTEASDILLKNQGKFKEPFCGGEGFSKEHELFLVKYCDNLPVFVVNWPKILKSFYMKQFDEFNVSALDLLAPNTGEIVGGSLREDNYEVLKQKIPNGNQLDWYLDIRRFGGVPTGGFGLGFERYLQFLLNINNIKDTIPFPRWPHNCSM